MRPGDAHNGSIGFIALTSNGADSPEFFSFGIIGVAAWRNPLQNTDQDPSIRRNLVINYLIKCALRGEHRP